MGTTAIHPGTIRMVDMFTSEVREVPAAEAPEQQQFVFFKNGIEVSDPHTATERIPIVEVEMYPLDEAGNLVSKERAATIRILEYGPQHRLLRTTTMLRGHSQ